MFRLKSHLWPACRPPEQGQDPENHENRENHGLGAHPHPPPHPHPHLQNSTNVSTKIAPLAGLPPDLQPHPHPRPQTSMNVSANIAPLAALPFHPPPGPCPGPGHHDHPRLWLLGALSSQKVRLSLCSAADCAKHIELPARGAPRPDFPGGLQNAVLSSLLLP